MAKRRWTKRDVKEMVRKERLLHKLWVKRGLSEQELREKSRLLDQLAERGIVREV